MDLQLTDKIAVVTGASKGIGLAITKRLTQEGALVVAGARTIEGLEQLGGVTPVAVDLADPQGPAALVGEAIARHGRVDVLVNNVGGVRPRLDGFLSLSDEDFEWSLQLNFFTALRATRAAVADMTKRGAGVIVNVSSVNAFFEPDGAVIDYGAAKAALAKSPSRSRRSSGPRGSASPASRLGRWRPICGSAKAASPTRSARRPEPDPKRSATARSRACRRGGSRLPTKSPQS
jgi:NAD(P)-dependent dehydrogenase (short-subunit alcohol dehydrogenase family)